MNIEANKLSLSLNEASVLNDISFNIPAKSLTTIMGPNGSGKSSLLKVLTNEIQNYTGQITKIPLKVISYLPQSLNSPPFLTIYEIVSLGCHGIKMNKKTKEQHIHHLMNICGVDSLGSKKIIDVSEGEKQRTWIAFALAQQKNAIMLDEPLSNIDEEGKKTFAKILRGLADEGKTVIIVSHDGDSLESSDHIIYLEQGNISFQGPVSEYQQFLLIHR